MAHKYKTHPFCTLVRTVFPEYSETSHRTQEQSTISGFTSVESKMLWKHQPKPFKKIINFPPPVKFHVLISLSLCLLHVCMCAPTHWALHFINGSQGPGVCVGGCVNTPFLMLGKGVKLCIGRTQRVESEEESVTEWDSSVLCPWARNGWTRGQEVSEKLIPTERDKMSEKERNQASQLQNKCELIRPQEAFI